MTLASVPGQDLKDYMRQAGDVTYADAHKNRRNEGCVEFGSYSVSAFRAFSHRHMGKNSGFIQLSHWYIGCASHSELNIPQPLLSRAVKSNCLGLSGPDASAGRSGWCFELPRMWGFHPYHFCLLHSAPWPSNMIWNSVLPLTALTAISIKTIPYFLAKNSV